MDRLYPTGPIKSHIKQISGLQKFRDMEKERFTELTDREVEILVLVSQGLKNSAIARKLDISRATVQNHRAHIRDKLNIESQVDYIKYAMAFDLMQL